MHKSIIIFLGLLTFLIPVAPSISNSNVLAFDEYEEGPYQQPYDDSYGQSYEGPYQQPYDDSYGQSYEGPYQQPYDDSYGQSYEGPYQQPYDDSYGQSYDSYEDMYSKYPTKDKKFVCEEGPFKGFFVVKPKFCDVELPPGPVGPQGPPGQNGTQGPAGLSTINTTNIYTVVGEPDLEIFTNDFGSSVAVCDLGDTALSGSFETTFVGGIGTIATMVSSKPLANETGWNATALQNTSGHSTVTADVVCFDNPPAHVEMAAADVSAFQQPEDAIMMSQGIEDSTKISQVTGDSSDLTIMEQLTKLKTQWLNQLP